MHDEMCRIRKELRIEDWEIYRLISKQYFCKEVFGWKVTIRFNPLCDIPKTSLKIKVTFSKKRFATSYYSPNIIKFRNYPISI